MNRLSFFILPLLACGLRAQSTHNFDYRPATVVVFNASDAGSTELANYYASQRGIPKENLVGLKCVKADTISREVFQKEIEDPLRAAFDSRKWWETAKVPKDGLVAVKTTKRILAIMQGVPLRIGEASHGKDPKTGQEIAAQPGQQNAACVDSELTALGVLEKTIDGFIPNPYCNQNMEFAKTPLAPMFLVGRLDGPDKAAVKRMIDDAIAVEKTGLYGKAYVDLALKNGSGYKMGEDWLKNAARMLESRGLPVIMDSWAPTLPLNFPMPDCAIYLGWYTDHADGPFLNPAFRFRRGAVACHIQSFSAAQLTNPKQNWCAPLLAKGACGTVGNVFEPYLPYTCAFDTLTSRLLDGYTLAEAAWMSTSVLSWMSTVLGDPLYRPFATGATGGDNKVDADYKALRLAAERWGKAEDTAALNENLARAAEKLKSTAIYEYLALHAQAGDVKAVPASKKWFELARTVATDPTEKMLLQFLMADAQRRDGDTKQATKILNALIEKDPASPEAATAKAWVQQIKDTK